MKWQKVEQIENLLELFDQISKNEYPEYILLGTIYI